MKKPNLLLIAAFWISTVTYADTIIDATSGYVTQNLSDGSQIRVSDQTYFSGGLFVRHRDFVVSNTHFNRIAIGNTVYQLPRSMNGFYAGSYSVIKMGNPGKVVLNRLSESGKIEATETVIVTFK